MHKWVNSSVSSSNSSSSLGHMVSLSRVLEVRQGHINEVEAWAMLAQATSCIQDKLLSINNSNNSTHAAASHRLNLGTTLVVTADRLMCTAAGKVSIDGHKPVANLEHVHPELRGRSDLSERELEVVAVFSLGKTIGSALPQSGISEALLGILHRMTAETLDSTATLLQVMRLVAEQWRLKVGSSPVSRFVSQLCRITLGWQVRKNFFVSCSNLVTEGVDNRAKNGQRSSALPSPPLPLTTTTMNSNISNVEKNVSYTAEKAQLASEKKEEDENEEVVEFSRLEVSSTSSSPSSSPSISSSPKLTLSDNIPPTFSSSSSNNTGQIGIPQRGEQPHNTCESHNKRRRNDEEEDDIESPTTTSNTYAAVTPPSQRKRFDARQRSFSSTSTVNGVRRAIKMRRRSSIKNLEAEDASDYENVYFGSSTTSNNTNLDKRRSLSAQLNGNSGGGSLMNGGGGGGGRKVAFNMMVGTQQLHPSSSSSYQQHPPGEDGISSSSSSSLLLSSRVADAGNTAPVGTGTTATTPLITNRNRLLNGRISSASATSSTTRSRTTVGRNPSRLYRVVRPLTTVTPTPSPATKRCVGPEFVVMAAASEQRPVLLDLSRRDRGIEVKEVQIVMLGGQRLVARVSPHSVTAGELLDRVLSDQDFKEASNYCVAVKRSSREEGAVGGWCEYWPLANESKLSKVAPLGWASRHKEGISHHHHNSQQLAAKDFILYLRFRFIPESVDSGFRDPNNKHQLYLQLRRDLLEGRLRLPGPQQQLKLAGLALQTEFGDFSEDIHGVEGQYFMLEHYLPESAVIKLGGQLKARESCARQHRAMFGQSQSSTELSFCRELQTLATEYGHSCFAVRETKKPNPHLGRRHLGVNLRGLSLFETASDPSATHRQLASYEWRNITRIQYDKCRFQISVQSPNSNSVSKMKFYVSEAKAKIMFDLSSAHHQFYLQRKWNRTETENGVTSVKRPLNNSSQMEGASSSSNSSSNNNNDDGVEYREPREKAAAIRSLKNKFLSRKQLSQRKLYTR